MVCLGCVRVCFGCVGVCFGCVWCVLNVFMIFCRYIPNILDIFGNSILYTFQINIIYISRKYFFDAQKTF